VIQGATAEWKHWSDYSIPGCEVKAHSRRPMSADSAVSRLWACPPAVVEIQLMQIQNLYFQQLEPQWAVPEIEEC
jgi:hypothetical protein